MNNKTLLYFFTILLLGTLFLTSSCSRKVKAETYIYQSKKSDFNFPEKSLQLQSTGVCFSGGGTRAMTCAAGQMKALDSLGLWPYIGYISSVWGKQPDCNVGGNPFLEIIFSLRFSPKKILL